MNFNMNGATAFILHSRSYQESSLILQLFSLEHGRFSVIAKGVKGKQSQARKAILQSFHLLSIEFVGKSDLKTLTRCELGPEQSQLMFALNDKALACAYYANELILRGIPESQEFPLLFQQYQKLIKKLQSDSDFQPVLRRFEMVLLTETGIAPDCGLDSQGNPINTDERYILRPQSGFSVAESFELPASYPGSAILFLGGGELRREDLGSIRQITRTLLLEVIGDKPLQSRKMWHHIILN